MVSHISSFRKTDTSLSPLKTFRSQTISNESSLTVKYKMIWMYVEEERRYLHDLVNNSLINVSNNKAETEENNKLSYHANSFLSGHVSNFIF